VQRILSSPFVRCLQTVAPLAASRALEVKPHPALAEGGGRDAARLVRSLAGEDSGAGVVVCSHGDVIPEVLLSVDAIAVEPGRRRCQKGSTWVVESVHGGLVATRYLPPPS